MKKTIRFSTLFIFLLITTTPLYSQWCSLGVKGGYSSILKQTQSYNEFFSTTNNLQNGGHIGIYMRLGHTWYIQPEALYNYYNYKSTINNTNTQYNIHTIDVPVLLGVHLVNTKMFKMRLMAGPKFNFNIGKLDNITAETFTQELRNTRLALDCGIGFDIWRITIDFRYNLMQDIFKIQNSESITLNKKPQHSIQSSIGFRLIGNNKKNKHKR